MIWAVIWFWILAVFTAADVVTTKLWLARGATEANPVLAPVIEYLVPIKIAFLVVVAVVIITVERESRGDGWVPPAAASAITFVAVLNNVIIVF